MWDIGKFSDLTTVTDIIRVKLNSEKCAKQYVVCSIKVWTFFLFLFSVKNSFEKKFMPKIKIRKYIFYDRGVQSLSQERKE